MAPKVTVLMPVYNAERFLANAIDSILGQSFDDFEFLIIDDGSTDNSGSIINGYADQRIKRVSTQNQGVAQALFLGIELAQGDYVARMDADDISEPERLERQVEVLDNNPSTGLVHTLASQIDHTGNMSKPMVGNALNNLETKWLLIWKNVIIHPSVMIRRSILDQNQINYSLAHNKAEDFQLWNSLARHTNFYCIKQPLLQYRVHSNSVTGTNLVTQHLAVYTDVVRNNLLYYYQSDDQDLVGDAINEIAIISDGSGIDARFYDYKHIHKLIRPLSENLVQRFCEFNNCDQSEIKSVRASQFLRWARNLIFSCSVETLKLLWRALLLRPRLVFDVLFIKVLVVSLLPKLFRSSFN